MRLLARTVFLLLAVPVVGRAALRCAWLERRLPLDELVSRLRATRPFAWARLANPGWLLATLDRLLPLMPPWRYGRCLKRSLLLLDLWSRCGLQLRLHLGVRREDEDGRYEGHAWVTVEGPARLAQGGEAAPQCMLATSSQGYPEAFVL